MPARTPAYWPILALVSFLALLGLVLADWAPLRQADVSLSERFRAYGTASPGTIGVIALVTDVMGTYAFVTIGLAASALVSRVQRRLAVFCLAVTVTVPVLWSLMHLLLHRPRPVSDFVDIDSNGFPSGHTAHAAATAITATLLLWPRLSRSWRTVTVALAVTLAAGIGATRVALLAHWPTDVLGGWLLALAVVPLLARLIVPAADPARPTPPPGPGSPPVPGCAAPVSPGSG